MRQFLQKYDLSEVRSQLTDTAAWRLLHLVSRIGGRQPIDESITQRGATYDRMMACAVDGRVTVEIWERDCDMVEATRLETIDANLLALNRLYERLSRDAEGPFTVGMLTPNEAANWQRTYRDRVLEAWENGRTYSV